MKKVKTFFHVFENSLFPLSSYYQKILRTSFRFSLKYFIVLILLLNFSFLLSLGFRFNPKKISTILTSLAHSLEKYPDDLTIIIKNGSAMGNLNHPYFLWLDYQNKKKLLFVFDETAPPQKIKTYNSLLLLTSKELVLNLNQPKNNQQFSSFPLTSVANQNINKQKASQMVFFLQRLIKGLFFVYLMLTITAVFTLPLVSFIITLFYLSLATFIVFSIYKFIFKKRVHLKKTLQIGFHSATLPLVLDYLIIISRPVVNLRITFPLAEFMFPLSFMILLSVFVFAGTYVAHLPKRQDQI